MRLTDKNYEVKSLGEPMICKLGQLEDIEEELGIDLITLFKVFVKGDNAESEE